MFRYLMTFVSCTVYIARNVSNLMMNWKGWGRNHSWPTARYYPNISLKLARITTKIPSQDTWFPYQTSKLEIPGDETEVWTTTCPRTSFLTVGLPVRIEDRGNTMVLRRASEKCGVRGQTAFKWNENRHSHEDNNGPPPPSDGLLNHPQSVTICFATKVPAPWNSKC